MSNWQTLKLGELVSIKTGKIDANKAVENGKYPFFTCAREISRIDDAPYEGKVVLVAGNGDLNVKYYEGKFNAYQRTYFLTSLDERKALPKYIFLFMEHYLQILRTQSIGTTVKYIKLENLRDAVIPLPPIDEQHKIVEILEDHLSRLDAALADVKQAKAKASQFRRSLLQAAFIGYFSDESFTIGSEIPPSWENISLGNVLEPRKQKDIPSSFPNLPYIGMEHVSRDVGLINSFGSSANYRSTAPRVYKGDVLYGRLRPYLNKVAISPCEAFASGEFIVLPPNEQISGKFLQLRLLSQDFVEFAGTLDTGDRPRVSWEQIARFELALPPIDEQMKMISSLEDHLSLLDASASLADTMEKQSNALRRSLLQAAFTGKLTKEVVSV